LIKDIKKCFSLFNKKEKKHYGIFVFLLILNSFLSVFSVAIVIPFVHVLVSGDSYFLNQVGAITGLSHNYQVVSLVALMILAFALKNAISFYVISFQAKFLNYFSARITQDLYKSYISKPYIYHISRDSGKIIRNINTEAANFTVMMTNLGNVLTELMLCLFLVSFLLYVNFSFSAIIFSVVSFSIWFYMKRNKAKCDKFSNLRSQTASKLNKSVIESLVGVKEVKLYNLEENYIDKVHDYSYKLADSNRFNNVYTQTPKLFLEVVSVFIILTMVAFFILSGWSGSKILALLSVFGVASIQLLPSSNRLTQAIAYVKYLLPAFRSIYEDLKSDLGVSGVEVNKNNKRLDNKSVDSNTNQDITFKNKIELRSVSFNYSDKSRVFKDISLTINKGESVAFIGPTGSGKTTLVDLICGFYEPCNGDVLIDGIPRNSYSKSSWNKLFGYVPQMIYLFDDSIKRNVAFGIDDKDIDEQKVWHCLSQANLDVFVKNLEDNINTVIGENGISLSGGQRQRLGIARALYHDPQILVFDEATSALDNKTEKEVTSAINAAADGRTMITIAHRMSTVKKANKVYKIANGQLNAEFLSCSFARV
jgi:ATP-binding cassette, subfamily B, bacterial PglK